jgi:hypothetical protein
MTAARRHAWPLIVAALLVGAGCSDADPGDAVATACKRDGSPERQCECRADITRSSVTEEDARGFAAYVRDSAPAPDAAAKLRYDAVLLAVTARCLTVD